MQLPGGADLLPWAKQALTYLDHRRTSGAADACPLPELFAALTEKQNGLSMTEFHDGIRLLRKKKAVRLLPFTGAPSDLPEPEYALLDGPEVLYYAAR